MKPFTVFAALLVAATPVAVRAQTLPAAELATTTRVAFAVRPHPPRLLEATFGAVVLPLLAIAAVGVAASAASGSGGGQASTVVAIPRSTEAAPAAPVAKSASIVDPALSISAALAKIYADANGAQVADEVVVINDSDTVAQVIAKAPGARYIIDAETTKWGYLYYSMDLSHFGAIYGVRLRLIDTTKGVVVAQGHCGFTKKKPKPAPTLPELLADDATLFKAQLQEAAESCVTELKTKTLKL